MLDVHQRVKPDGPHEAAHMADALTVCVQDMSVRRSLYGMGKQLSDWLTGPSFIMRLGLSEPLPNPFDLPFRGGDTSLRFLLKGV